MIQSGGTSMTCAVITTHPAGSESDEVEESVASSEDEELDSDDKQSEASEKEDNLQAGGPKETYDQSL